MGRKIFATQSRRVRPGEVEQHSCRLFWTLLAANSRWRTESAFVSRWTFWLHCMFCFRNSDVLRRISATRREEDFLYFYVSITVKMLKVKSKFKMKVDQKKGFSDFPNKLRLRRDGIGRCKLKSCFKLIYLIFIIIFLKTQFQKFILIFNEYGLL